MTHERARPGTVDTGRERLRELLAELSAGDSSALATLYAACSDELYGLALWRTGKAEDAADVVQEVFVRLVAARDRLGRVDDPLSYLRRITHRASIDVHRRSRRRREEPIDTCALLEAPQSPPERRLDAHRVSDKLGQLPPAQREAIYLRHFAGCSFAEIGRTTGVPTFTAASRYRIGMKRLRRLVGVEP